MRVSGLSGNEIYCLAQRGWTAGGIVIGNSVQSLGVVGGIASGLKSMAGGEITNMTSLISEGRHLAISRIEEDARQRGAEGLTSVSTELKSIGGMVEFLAIGSAIHSESHQGALFSTACTGQELFCHLDAGYEPRHFVIGNVAYSLGIGRGISGSFRTFARGEVKEFSDLYNHTRHLALERLENEAAEMGCNAVVDIKTEVLNIGGVREMLMVGTGSHNNV
ncbi:MAG: YbjQ family protein, partial [bacterium]|nr:YbjQ family protein [bacterium]